MSKDFWAVINAQLEELRAAKSADDVMRILSKERNPLGPNTADGEGFFAGSGGDGSVLASLEEAGWETTWYRAHYYWVAQAPNGDKITYVEGDIYRGNQALRG